MDPEPRIIALDTLGEICAITDETGKIAGTGTRQVCEVILHIIRRLRTSNALKPTNDVLEPRRHNVHAAITI